MSSVDEAYQIGFGMPVTGRTYPALYMSGMVNKVLGIYRSDDIGASWVRLNDDQHQYGWINVITGDSRILGRVYIGTAGRGILYGEPEKSPLAIQLPANHW